MLKIAAVIVNWNQPELTLECLKSVSRLRVTGYELSVIVVDNGSEMPLPPSKDYKLIKNKKNLGFAGGNNVGIREALEGGATYILILNNDTTVERELLIHLVKAIEEGGVGAVSPKIYFAKGFEFHKKYKAQDLGKVIWYAGGIIDWGNVYGQTRGVDKVDRGQFDERGETDFATGACMLLSSQALKEVGFFDEKYFMYYEDTDLSMRMKKKGWAVTYEPKGLLWHKVAQSSGIGSDLNDYFITRNRMLFGMSYASLRTKVALIKESVRLLLMGRRWQRIGIRDFYLGRLGQGSWTTQEK